MFSNIIVYLKLFYVCSCITAMDMARKELKQVIPQRMQIPSTQLHLLQSVGHGQFAVQQQHYSLSIFSTDVRTT